MTASTFEMLGSMVQQHMSVLLFHGLLHLAHQQATESDTASDGESTQTETDEESCSWSDDESDDTSVAGTDGWVDDIRFPATLINPAAAQMHLFSGERPPPWFLPVFGGFE